MPPIYDIIDQKNKAVTNEKTGDDSEKEKSVTPDNIEQDKKKRRRRKNKLGSEEPEENNIGHRVVIRDDQVRFFIVIRYIFPPVKSQICVLSLILFLIFILSLPKLLLMVLSCFSDV